MKEIVTQKQKDKKINEAIKMVNDVVKLRLGVSKVHGVGVIAMRDIKRGEKLYATAVPVFLDIPYKKFNKFRPEISELILDRFPNVKTDKSHFMSPDTLMQLYLNHSDKPNYDSNTDKATRKIKAGEEVLQDYRQLKDYKKVFKWLK